MSIKITVTGETPLEVLAEIAQFGLRCLKATDVATVANQIYKAEKTLLVKTPEDKPAEREKPPIDPAQEPTPAKQSTVTDLPEEPYVEDPPHGEPAPAAVSPAPVFNPNPNPGGAAAPTAPPAGGVPGQIQMQVPVAQAPSYTKAQLGKAGGELIAADPGKLAALNGLLQQFGVLTVNDLPEAQVGAFAAAMRSLGARL